MIDPVTGQIILTGVQALGSGLGAYASGQQANKNAQLQQQQLSANTGLNYQQLGQNDRQFQQNSNLDRAKYLDDRATNAARLQQRLNMAPMADRASYLLQQRLGVSPGPVQIRDYTTGTMPGEGQVGGGATDVLGAMQRLNSAYQPGAGGFDTRGLTDALAQLRDPSQVPGMYGAQSPDQMRYAAEMQQLMIDAANAKTSQDRLNIQARMARLQQSLGGTIPGGPGALPTVTMEGDAAQAAQDAVKQSARRRMATMAGVGGAIAGVPGAVLGALGSRLFGRRR